MKLFRLKLILFVFILSFTLQSCTGIKNLVATKSSVRTPSPNKPTTQASSQSPDQVANLAQKHINAGNYQKAINIYRSEHRKHPQDLQFMQMYAKSLDSIKSTADDAFEKKDFAYAGRIYYVLKKNYGKFSHVVQMLSFDNAYLNAKLSYCKKFLSIKGFQEYREGHLNSALVSWQCVLDIDPNNKNIKETMRTAKLQQKNLP
jgi:tetratricopeptide (TPR) repeat protein